SSMPAKASDEFIKPKKITRSSIGKPQLSTGMKHSRRVSFKAGKGNISAKGMEGLVFGDDESEGVSLGMMVLMVIWIQMHFLMVRVWIQGAVGIRFLKRMLRLI
ncbi:hypothetical protein Tco_0944514, partial [Tanacetum coccineum]